MIYNDKYLTFPDKETQEQYFDQSDLEAPVNTFPQLHWDVIGVIYTPGTYDIEGNELTPPMPKNGWHVNICYHFLHDWPTELDQYVITAPDTPYRIRPVSELSQDRRKSLSVSRLQADKMIRMMGLKDTVEAWLETQSEDIQTSYNLAYRFERTDALWDAVKVGFGWSDLDLDRLFVRANDI